VLAGVDCARAEFLPLRLHKWVSTSGYSFYAAIGRRARCNALVWHRWRA
jgi:hypothetical protein